MFNKVNVLDIVKNHLGTLIDDSTGNPRPLDFVLFFIFPLSIATALTFYFKVKIDGNLAGLLATVLSIVTGLLFNLLVLIFDISGRNKEVFKKKERVSNFLEQIYINISFSILIAILAVILVILRSFNIWPAIGADILSFGVYFLVSLFLLTLLMVLKRIDTLLLEDFKEYKKPIN